MKKYNDIAFEELRKALVKYTGNGGGMCILLKMINENDEEFPGLKNTFIHDMNKFLTHWFYLNNEVKSCSIQLKAKVLSRDFINEHYIKDFDRLVLFCYDKIDKKINKFTNRLLAKDIVSHLDSTVKSLIQYKRISLGLDNNCKKFSNQ